MCGLRREQAIMQLKPLLKSTWLMPIKLALLTIIGLIGALMSEGILDVLFISFLVLVISALLLALVKD